MASNNGPDASKARTWWARDSSVGATETAFSESYSRIAEFTGSSSASKPGWTDTRAIEAETTLGVAKNSVFGGLAQAVPRSAARASTTVFRMSTAG